MDRPDLSESAVRRAWKDAKRLGLETVAGALVTTAGGAAGGTVGNHWGSVGLVIGAVIGAGIGFVLFWGLELLRVMRRQRDDLRTYVRNRNENERILGQFKQTCLKWAKDVEHFAEVQKAKQPRLGKGQVVERLMGREVESDEDKRERARVEREAVSLYIERFREDGLKYFDLLISWGKIVDKGRPTVESPKTILQIEEAADLVRTAADRL
jgi:hypothetical protein